MTPSLRPPMTPGLRPPPKPGHDVRIGAARRLRTELRTLVGCCWHVVRRRCAYGIVMGSRTAGSIREALAERRS